MILLQSFSQLLEAGVHRGALFREVNWSSCGFSQLPCSLQLYHVRVTRTPRALSLTARTNDNVVTIGIARIARSSMPSGVSDPVALCVEESP